jgi:glucan biosynthesis protein
MFAGPLQSLNRSTKPRGRIRVTILMTLLAGGMPLNPPARADGAYVRDGAFDRDTVTELARRLSRAPFAPPKSPLPKTLADLDYDH